MPTDNILSVTELNNYAKGKLDTDVFLSNVCVRGEISGYTERTHAYFSIKDDKSVIKVIMFKSYLDKVAFKPQNGDSVIINGKVTIHAAYGSYQINAYTLTPEGTGALQLAFERLKQSLMERGLFDEAHKVKLPEMPSRIAVITSDVGDAVHDIIRITGKRWPLAEICVLPVKVQGKNAALEIAGALRYADKHRIGDVIITGRGGGSLEDLWAFNEEAVAEAIYECRTPVISAVGHEPDVTISDYVADVRASTPSNAAERAVPDISDIKYKLLSLQQRMVKSVSSGLNAKKQILNSYAAKQCFKTPEYFLQLKYIELDRHSEKLSSLLRARITKERIKLSSAASALDAMSPLKVMGRGYSAVYGENKTLITGVEQVNKGDRITLRLIDGAIKCLVEDIDNGNEL